MEVVTVIAFVFGSMGVPRAAVERACKVDDLTVLLDVVYRYTVGCRSSQPLETMQLVGRVQYDLPVGVWHLACRSVPAESAICRERPFVRSTAVAQPAASMRKCVHCNRAALET
eukprot:GHVU01200591.1.p1 GENE.GHVU01200591.1~~GHVU01200591.1.p1  ORF type:complete len:114 (-),score=4.23 GHVU01200591.1:147-488(-)